MSYNGQYSRLSTYKRGFDSLHGHQIKIYRSYRLMLGAAFYGGDTGSNPVRNADYALFVYMVRTVGFQSTKASSILA